LAWLAGAGLRSCSLAPFTSATFTSCCLILYTRTGWRPGRDLDAKALEFVTGALHDQFRRDVVGVCCSVYDNSQQSQQLQAWVVRVDQGDPVRLKQLSEVTAALVSCRAFTAGSGCPIRCVLHCRASYRFALATGKALRYSMIVCGRRCCRE